MRSGTISRLGFQPAIGTSSPHEVSDISSDFILGGSVSGSVQNISVSEEGADAAFIGMTVGDHGLCGILNYGERNNDFRLTGVSQTDYISLCISGTGLCSLDSVYREFRTLFGLESGTPLWMQSEFSDLSMHFSTLIYPS